MSKSGADDGEPESLRPPRGHRAFFSCVFQKKRSVKKSVGLQKMAKKRKTCKFSPKFDDEFWALKRKNKRLHRDWDKLYDLCLDKGCTEDEIIKEMER